MTVDVRILGELEVVVDGARVRLAGRMQRTLLAALVVSAGEIAPRDRLHEALWPGAARETAARNLKSYVYSLRKSLGPAGERVQTRPDGYLLDVSAEEVDAGRFERLAAEGRTELAAGRPARAAESLRAALGLWRGDVLADLRDEAFAAQMVMRLEALRLDAVEDRVDADLALGRGADLVAELQALAAEEPLRERRQRQLMLALYRSGRHAEALDVFTHTRAGLLELGLEPSQALRDLQTAILRQDAALDAETAGVRLRNVLPAPATPLVGRRAELDELGRILRGDGARLVTLTGPGGVGKSRLALHAAEELGEEFDHGAVFVALAPLTDARLVPDAIAEALGVDDGGGRPVLEALAEHLRTRRLLLLVDNFEHVDEAASVLADLLAAAPGLTVLVTSRTALRLYGEFEYPVAPLHLEAEAVPLFVTRARARGATFSDADAPFVAALCRRLDCLPLAIELVAARARELTEDQLAFLTDPLDLAAGGPRDLPARQQTLRATIDWSHERLAPDEQLLFRRLSVFTGGCTAAAAEAVCGAAADTLASLVADSLLSRGAGPDGEQRVLMLETIRDYARERLRQSGEADEVCERHTSYFLTLAERAEEELVGGAERGPWLDRLAAEHDNFRAALSWAHDHDSVLELRLAAALRLFWELRGHLGEGRATLAAALARQDRKAPEARAKALNAAAVMAYRQGDLGETQRLIDESLVLYRELGDEAGVGRALGELGNVASESGDHARAIALYEECAAVLRATGNELGLATVLANIGDVAFKDGDYDRAAKLLEEAVRLQRKVKDVDGVASSLFTLGRVFFSQGALEKAARTLEESLALAEEVGYPEGIGYCLAGLGHVALAVGEPEQAARLLGAADATFERIGAAMQQVERDAFDEAVAATEKLVGQEAFAASWDAGRALDPEHAAAEGRAAAADLPALRGREPMR